MSGSIDAGINAGLLLNASHAGDAGDLYPAGLSGAQAGFPYLV